MECRQRILELLRVVQRTNQARMMSGIDITMLDGATGPDSIETILGGGDVNEIYSSLPTQESAHFGSQLKTSF